jgi:hypothetical protein
MHVVRFFQPLFFTPNVEVIETSLPNTVGRLSVNRFRQGNPREHAATPTWFTTLQTFNDVPGRSLLQTADDARRAMTFAGPDQPMKMIRHDDIAYKSEIKLISQLVEGFNEPLSEVWRVKQANAAISARSDEMKMVPTIKVMLFLHTKVLPCALAFNC